jgi:phosphoribosyl-AMP cyclohydrolase
LGRIEIPNSSETNGRFSGVVSIGTDCKVQTLRMVVRASSKVGGVSGQIDRIMIL